MTNLRKIISISFFSIQMVNHSLNAQQQEKGNEDIDRDTVYRLEEVVVSGRQILGSKFKARNRTGSAYYISPEEIRKFGYTDINRMLKAVPGVNMYEEDGFGLRPNISLRGTKAERSERISIMEDGILAAPAPYSAPAAYYFPNAARMEAVEVVKGSRQVQYGPFTTGGAINMVSTPIPNTFSGTANLSYGSKNTFKSHTHIGNMWKHFGFMVEYLRYQSDGFKKYEDHPVKGFNRDDLIAKVMVKTDKGTGVNHALELKFGYAGENSDETYVGLSEEDFKDGQVDILTIVHKAGLAASRSEARRNVQQGGVTVDGEKVTDIAAAYTKEQLQTGLLVKRGKKNFKKVVVKEDHGRKSMPAGKKMRRL